MDDNILTAIGMVGLAGIGGCMGYLWAGLLTAAEIAAVSNPVGIVCGAIALPAIAYSAGNTN